MQYDVINSTNLNELIKYVERAIRLGWKPIGGVYWRSTKEKFNDDGIYMQAMVREGEAQ